MYNKIRILILEVSIMLNVTKEQIFNLMKLENPWWGKYPSITDFYRRIKSRPYFELFYPNVIRKDPHRALILMGPRRVGKTVMLHHAIQRLLDSGVNPLSICYFSIEHPIYFGLGLYELLDYFVEVVGSKHKKGLYVFFDEVQYLDDWERHLKVLVDSNREVKFIASGSSSAALRLKSIESGAGRFTDFILPPLNFYEYLYLIDKAGQVPHLHEEIFPSELKKLNEEFINYLNYGGFPEAIFSKTIQEKPYVFIKSDIVDRVLLRDLPFLYGIQDIRELNSFFKTLVLNTGGEVSLEKLSENSNVAKNTIIRYLTFLEAAFLIKLIYRVDQDGKGFKRDNFFKVYLTNPSLYNVFFGPISSSSAEIGRLVETAIFSQSFFLSRHPFNYARWRSGEIDIVSLPIGNPAKVIEVKWSDRHVTNRSELASIIGFCHRHNIPQVDVTTKTVKEIKTIDNIRFNFVPSSLFCFYAYHFFREHFNNG